MKRQGKMFLARAAMMLLVAMLTTAGAWAQTIDDYTVFTGYVADGYSTPDNGNSNANERYDKLVDGNANTKWCVVNGNYSNWHTSYVDFHTVSPVVVKGYKLTTGNDVENNPGRNPQKWNLYGKAKLTDDWTVIDTRNTSTQTADALPATNKTEKTYAMASNTAAYKYFRFEVTGIVGTSNSGKDYTLELSELQLYGNLAGSLAGGGTAASPYLISNSDDWDVFVDLVNYQNSTYATSSTCYKLTADISVTTMVGTETNPFRGIFDGSGHTLTVNYTASSASEKYVAPFRYIGASEFKNLHTAGTITINNSSYGYFCYASGLICQNVDWQNLTITKCWSSVDISYTESDISSAYLNGFVATPSAYLWLTFTDCRFDGNITVTGGATYNYCSSFVGYGSAFNKISFNNCLMAGTIDPSTGTYSKTFSLGKITENTQTVEYNNSYYTQNVCESNQGTAVGDMTVDALATQLGAGWTVDNGKAVPTVFGCILLADNAADNSTKLTDGDLLSVKLDGRTLKKNGEWNTICLPFDVVLANSPLAGATAKTLTTASVNGNTVTLNFGEAVTTLQAGVPYIIKWAEGEDIENPVFTGVTIDKTDNRITAANGQVKFIGYYDAFGVNATNTDIYYMTAGSTLKHTSVARTLNACRAYFQFADPNNARNIVLNFGEDETTAIAEMRTENGEMRNGAWYTVDGLKLYKKPTRKGLYIFNGKKTVIR